MKPKTVDNSSGSYFRQHAPECLLVASGVAITLIGAASLFALLYRGGVLLPHRVTFGGAIGGLGGGFVLVGTGGAIFLFRKPSKKTADEDLSVKSLPLKEVSESAIFPTSRSAIPVDIARHILSYLNFPAAMQLGKVSHAWRSIVYDTRTVWDEYLLNKIPQEGKSWRERAIEDVRSCASGEAFKVDPKLNLIRTTSDPVSVVVASQNHILTKKHMVDSTGGRYASEFEVDGSKTYQHTNRFEIGEGAQIAGEKLVYQKGNYTCVIEDLQNSSRHEITSDSKRFGSVFVYKDQVYIGSKDKIFVYSLDGVLNKTYKIPKVSGIVSNLFVDRRGVVCLLGADSTLCIFDHDSESPKTVHNLDPVDPFTSPRYERRQEDPLVVGSDEVIVYQNRANHRYVHSISRSVKNAPIEMWKVSYYHKPMAAHEYVLIGCKGPEFQIHSTKTKEILNTINVGSDILSIAMRGSEILVSTKDNKLLSYKWA